MVRLRGEVCVGFASLLSLVAVLLLIFLHVGQTNTSSVPRSIAMVTMNTSGYGVALGNSFQVPIQGLYTNNATAPLQNATGLRQIYEFGLYSYCAFMNSSLGTCTNHTAARPFEPYQTIKADMILNYTQFTDGIFYSTATIFTDNSYFGSHTHAAYYFLIIGAVLAIISLITGIIHRSWTFVLSSVSSVIAAIFILIGAAIWTAVIKKAESVNTYVTAAGYPAGIEVAAGKGLALAWAAFACLTVSTIPYMISCCTFRG